MKNMLTIIGLMGTVTLSSNTTYAANQVALLHLIDARFQDAANAFSKNGNEDAEIKVINGDENSDTDSPNKIDTKSFMGPTKEAGEMICYKTDTGKIVAADSPNKVGADFDKQLATKINDALNLDADGKVEVKHTVSTQDPNDEKSQKQGNMMTVAWGKGALTGKKDSLLVCTITAAAPAA
jgi:hypothetical protein